MSFSIKKADFVFIVILFLLAGVVSWSFYFKTYKQQDTVNIHEFPKSIGSWTSEELVITEDEYRILETKNTFVRRYTSPNGEEVLLFIVYSQNNRKVAHPPEVCYTGGGVVITSNEHASVPVDSSDKVISANKLRLETGADKQIAFYWFKVGDSFTSNYWQQQGLIALKTLMGQSVGSALVRISTPLEGDNDAAATRRIVKFSNLILPSLKKHLP